MFYIYGIGFMGMFFIAYNNTKIKNCDGIALATSSYAVKVGLALGLSAIWPILLCYAIYKEYKEYKG